MRVATYNIHRGRGRGGRFRPERIAQVIAELGADLVALQEAQHYLRWTRPMLDVAWLEREAGLRPLTLAGRDGEQGWRSNVLLVRSQATVLRPPVGLRLGGMEPRGAILAELDFGGGALRIIAAHLSLGAARRRRQAGALLAAAQAEPPTPTLLLGDLNEWRADGAALAVLAPRFGRPPAAPTFPAFRPFLSLDRIMGHPPGLVASLAVHDTPLARRASDHLPLVAEIGSIPPAVAP